MTARVQNTHKNTRTQIIAYADDACTQPLAQESATCQDCVRQKLVGVGLCSSCAQSQVKGQQCAATKSSTATPASSLDQAYSKVKSNFLRRYIHYISFSDGAPIRRDLV